MHVKWVSTLLVALIVATTSISIAVAADTGPPPADPAAPGQPAAASGETSKPGDAPPPSVTIIGAKEAHAVLGRDVRSTSGEDMGRIVDIIVDKGGAVRAAVIDFGGFLGVGSRKIVVDWNALHFVNVDKKGDSITLDLTREQVKAAPEYSEDKPIVVLGASGKLQPLPFDPQ